MQGRIHKSLLSKGLFNIDSALTNEKGHGGQGIFSLMDWGRYKDYVSESTAEDSLFKAAGYRKLTNKQANVIKTTNALDTAFNIEH